MGGKDGSPGGGVPSNELWWRIPMALAMFIGLEALAFALVLSPIFLIAWLLA